MASLNLDMGAPLPGAARPPSDDRTSLPDELNTGPAGRTFRLVCGDREWWCIELVRLPAGEWIVSMLFELCELAFEWPACRGMLRMELTEEDVDFRPRRPAPEDRRRDWLPRGVRGEGERDVRVAFEPVFW